MEGGGRHIETRINEN